MSAGDSVIGLFVGAAFLFVGLICMVGRLSGVTLMQLELWPIRCRIKTSLPGVVFAVLGLLVIYLTRPA
jgi:hypothetical protein